MSIALTGQRIREVRTAKGLSQSALAKDVGISPAYLNLIEHNKRRIAGRTLQAIAARLGVTLATLTDMGDAALPRKLASAAQAAGAGAELERTGELIARFPGWADTLAERQTAVEARDDRISLLADRLNNDPYFATSLHQILSRITAIRATADILTEHGDMENHVRDQFFRNISRESADLAETARALVGHLDKEDEVENPVASAVWGETRRFWDDRATAPETAEIDGDEIADPALAASLARYRAAQITVPDAALPQAAKGARLDPLAIARALNAPVRDVMLRLAHPPSGWEDAPTFGAIETDASGGVVLRKPHDAMALPEVGGACPLWPLYRAFAQPGRPFRALLSLPTGERMIAHALAEPYEPPDHDAPPVLRSLMIYTDAPEAMPGRGETAPQLEVGPHCSICSRKACASRRNPYILG